MSDPLNLNRLPDDLPRPEDDGACDHLPGMTIPPISLPSTAGRDVRLADSDAPRTVVYAYPMTGVPGQPLPDGWDMIPGARGCTPEACSFRDHSRELAELGAGLFGLSTQTTAYQQEMVQRLHLPFEVLSDHELRLTKALGLPVLEVAGMVLMKRLTLVLRAGRIERVFYPVFPPDRHAEEVVAWLGSHPL
ncbi:peroxiredoxin [Rhodospirillaceae bacterium SYSU D60014]|uniref:peroxiredoxin n=1 Tax=Virgifigura deserti TaxID=2268457 RepID=UPI000E667C7B